MISKTSKMLALTSLASISSAAPSPVYLNSGWYQLTSVGREGSQKPSKDVRFTCLQGGEHAKAHLADLMPSFQGEQCTSKAPVFDVARRQFSLTKRCTDGDTKVLATLSGSWTAKSYTAQLELYDQSQNVPILSAKIAAVRKRDCTNGDLKLKSSPSR